MRFMTKLLQVLFGRKEKDQITDSIIICVEIGNSDAMADKLKPGQLMELLQAVHNYIERDINKYCGVVASYHPGTFISAIPKDSQHLDSSRTLHILLDLWQGVNAVYSQFLLSDMQPSLSLGADSGACLISRREQKLILGNVVINAQKICKHALKSDLGILISSNVIGDSSLFQNKIVAHGVVPGSDIKVWTVVGNNEGRKRKVSE